VGQRCEADIQVRMLSGVHESTVGVPGVGTVPTLVCNGAVTTILSIQSSVAYGHVGNSAATFPLMRVGVEVWPVITVHFSNHTGYGAWRGPLLSASDIAEVVTGIDERGVLGRVDAVLSGYQGAEEVGAEVLRTVELVKSRNPHAIYCCDPVIGDVGRGVYVRPGIPEFLRDRVVPAAQIVTPNHFELDLLTGRTTRTLDEVVDAADALRSRGPEVVLVTSTVLEGGRPEEIVMLVDTSDGVWQVTTPRLERSFTGSGDLTAALFLAHYLEGDHAGQAMGRTADVVYSLLRATAEAGSDELLLVGAQDQLVSPDHHFEVERLR
jgi:pyridoxine kinase